MRYSEAMCRFLLRVGRTEARLRAAAAAAVEDFVDVALTAKLRKREK